MTGDRLRARIPAFTAAFAAAVYTLWFRRRVRTWGATRDVVARDYPGDELIPIAQKNAQ